MPLDRRLDVGGRSTAEPDLEDNRQRATIGRSDPDHDLTDPSGGSWGMRGLAEGRPADRDCRPPGSRRGLLDAQGMDDAAVAELGPVDELVG